MLFVGDDWSEDHHDVHIMDEAGARLGSQRLPEGLAGIARLHELIGDHTEEADQVVIGIETDLSADMKNCPLADMKVPGNGQ